MGRLSAHRSRATCGFLASQRDWPAVERLSPYVPELNPVEGLCSNLKRQELVNLAHDTLGEVTGAAWQAMTSPQSIVAAVFVPATGSRLGAMTPSPQDPNL